MRNKKSVARVLLFLLWLVMVVPFPASAAREERPVLRVAYYDFGDANLIDKDGTMSGFGYEYLMELARYTDWDYDFITTYTAKNGDQNRLTYEQALIMLEKGEVDIMANVGKTPGRERRLYFPQYPAGTAFGILSTRVSNVTFAADNLQTMEGITVGLVKGSLSNDEIKTYFAANNVKNVRYVEFDTCGKLELMLAMGSLDAVFTNNLRHAEGERQILRLSPYEYYFALPRNSPYKEELNHALEELMLHKPALSESLTLKYHNQRDGGELSLSLEEQEYIQQNPVVRIAVGENFAPIEYIDEQGTYRGIVADMLSEISDKTGLTFEYVPVTKELTNGDFLERQHIQAVAAAAYDYRVAERNKLRLTGPYIELPMSVVVHDTVQDHTVHALKVAVPGKTLTGTSETLKKAFENHGTISTLNYLSSLRAVNNGFADLTYMESYCVAYDTSQIYFNRIRTLPAYDFNYALSLAVPESADPLLYGILNRAVDTLSTHTMEKITYQNILVRYQSDWARELLFKYPMTIIAVLMLLLVAVIISFTAAIRTYKRVEKEKHLNYEKLHIGLAKTNITVWEYEIRNRRIWKISGGEAIFEGMNPIEDVPQSMVRAGYVHPDSKDEFCAIFARIDKGETVAEGVVRLRVAQNTYHWEKITLFAVLDKGRRAVSAMGVMEDAEDSVALQRKAERDPLTQLLNREAFRRQCEAYLRAEMNVNPSGALFLIDCDNFKLVNDALGHQKGDEVLKDFARKLTECFSPADLICRLGGDEFLVLMKHADSIEEVQMQAKRLCDALIIENDGIVTTGSVGITMIRDARESYEKLYAKADAAMYYAKKSGKRRYIIWEEHN